MKVHEIMTTNVETCPPGADLGAAALLMWKRDCGAVPVVDPATQKILGMITDRDICVGLATSGLRPHERTVHEVYTRGAITVAPDAEVRDALGLMERHQVRRLPVAGDDGRLQGMLSINDLILRAEGGRAARVPHADVMRVLQAVSRHRAPVAKPSAAKAPATKAGRRRAPEPEPAAP